MVTMGDLDSVSGGVSARGGEEAEVWLPESVATIGNTFGEQSKRVAKLDHFISVRPHKR